MMRLLHAAWIAPMVRPPLRDGAVVFDEKSIIEVGPTKKLKQRHPDALADDAGNSVILPGLVNAHTHLEFSGCTPPAGTGEFVPWLLALISQTRGDPVYFEEAARIGTAHGIEQCLSFGVTAVGDITRLDHVTRPVLRDSPLRAVSYGEVQGMGQRRDGLEDCLAAAIDSRCASPRLRIGVSPHAPYSIEPQGYRRCLQAAQASALPLATHLAETPHEAEFLAQHSGPFRRLWDALGWWDDRIPRIDGGAIRYARALGLLEYPTLLAHVNYCDDDELAILARSRASIVYCPRTHAYFRHPPHRWREMLARGINVAVGTDSCASSPDLDMVEDLRLLHRLAPEVPAQVIWEMATLRSARAIGQEDALGAIAPGKCPDFAVFRAQSDQPLQEVLQTRSMPAQVWIAGQRAR